MTDSEWSRRRLLGGMGSALAAGAVDIGIYSLNAARHLSGEEPVAISAMASTDRSDPRFATVEDRIDWQMRFPSGLIANRVSSYSSNHNQYRVTGPKGWVGLEPATVYQGQQMRLRLDGKTEDRVLPAPAKDQFVGQLDHFAECIRDGREPLVPGEEGLRDLRAIEAIYRSAREGRAVTL